MSIRCIEGLDEKCDLTRNSGVGGQTLDQGGKSLVLGQEHRRVDVERSSQRRQPFRGKCASTVLIVNQRIAWPAKATRELTLAQRGGLAYC